MRIAPSILEMEGRDYLRQPIQLSEAVKRGIDEAESFKQECYDIGRKVDNLGKLLRQAARLSTNASKVFYEHPTRRIMEEARKTLDKTLALVKKCKKTGMLKRVITITNAADFHKVNRLLDSAKEDLNWLLTISEGGDELGLPPIAANDPILAFIWQQIAKVQTGSPDERADAAANLASLASDNERNGKIIIEEGGLAPLMKLMQDGTPTGQEIAAKALCELARDQQRAQEIVKAGAVQTFVSVLSDAPVKAQTQAARALAAIVSYDTDARSAFGAAGAIRHLVALINDSIEETAKTNMHAVVRTRMAQSKAASPPVSVPVSVSGKPKQEESGGAQEGHLEKKPGGAASRLAKPEYDPKSHVRSLSSENGKSAYGGGGSHRENRRDREHEDPETIMELRAEVVKALWKLATNNYKNCKNITDTRALLCFAKLMEKEGDVQRNAVMAIAEIAAVAEQDSQLRWAAFKMTSPAVRAVVEQLLKVIQSDDPDVQVPSLRAIGCLARIFPAKETHIVKPITEQLGKDSVVASEAATALQKFTTADNYLKVEHSRNILEANGASHLVTLTYFGEAPQPVVLLCNLVMNVGDHPAFKSPNVLKSLESAFRSPQLNQVPALRDMLPQAIEHLKLFQAGDNAQLESEYDF